MTPAKFEYDRAVCTGEYPGSLPVPGSYGPAILVPRSVSGGPVVVMSTHSSKLESVGRVCMVPVLTAVASECKHGPDDPH